MAMERTLTVTAISVNQPIIDPAVYTVFLLDSMGTTFTRTVAAADIGDYTINATMSVEITTDEQSQLPLYWIKGSEVETGWQIDGFFRNEAEAVALCSVEEDFVGPLMLGDTDAEVAGFGNGSGEAPISWTGSYHPITP